MSLRLTIRASLTLFVLALLGLVIVVSAGAVIGLQSLKTNAIAIDQKWLAGSRMLGEMSDHLSEFRLAETYRVLARAPADVAKVDASAAEHGRAVAEIEAKYIALVGVAKPESRFGEFDGAWQAYMVAHDRWAKEDPNGVNAEPSRPDSAYDELYETSDQALDALMDAAAAAADGEVEDAKRIADRDTILLVILSAVAIALSAALVALIGTRITGPLAAITSALTRLAKGCRNGQVPEILRNDEVGDLAKAFEVFRANAVELEQAQILANSLARHDALTGLPNRRRFASELDDALERAKDGESQSALLLIDLDHFKPINDLHGHAAGDLVLCEVADRLKAIAEREDVVARIGGDEFAMLFEVPADATDRKNKAVGIAARVVQSMREPIEVGEIRAEIGASIGIALCPADGTTAEDVLRAADLAMYRAKQDGRNAYRFFEQQMDEDLRARAVLEADFRTAVASGEVKPFYQPLIGLDGHVVYGFEVLARWQRGGQGFVSPDVFIPLAEQTGLMDDLTASVLGQACRDARSWGDHVQLAINISPSQFQDQALATRLMAILSREDFPPSRLEVEVTESALVGDLEAAKATLTALHGLGIKVALDDFGTGYSSLYHLRELKFDKLKIDRSFVQSMQANPESEKIVHAVLSLAESLGMPAVAEGIEDAETMSGLAKRGCAFGQGYFFSRAVPAAEAELLLDDGACRGLKSELAG